MLDLAKQKAFEKSVENELAVPTEKDRFIDKIAPFRWVMNFINKGVFVDESGAKIKAIANLIESVEKVDAKLFGLADKLDINSPSTKALRAAHTEINGLLTDLKTDVKGSLLRLVNNDLEKLRVALKAKPHQLKGLSPAELKEELTTLYSNLSQEQKEKVDAVCDRIRNSVERKLDPVFRAHAVVNITESLATKIKEERTNRSLDLTDPAVATAFTSAIGAAFTGLSTDVAAIRGANYRGAVLESSFETSAKDALVKFNSTLDSTMAVTNAGRMLAQIGEYNSMLSGAPLNLAGIPDNKIVVQIPNGIKASLLARLNADITPVARQEIQDSLNVLSSGASTGAQKKAATDLIQAKFAGMNDKLQQIQKLVDGVCEQFAEVMDSEKKITFRGTPILVPTYKEKALELFAPKLINQVKAEMVADYRTAAEIATEETAISTRFSAIQASLVRAIETKLGSLLADTTVATADMGKKCADAVRKGLDLLEESNLMGRFPAEQDDAARAKAMNDLENDLRTALA